MGKKLIIKGADFSVNGIDVDPTVEHYLEYDGNSYFFPDIAISNTDRIEVKFMLSQLPSSGNTSGMGVFFGRKNNTSDDNAVGIFIALDLGGSYSGVIGVEAPGTNRNYTTYKATINTMYNVVVDSQTCVINGQTVASVAQKNWSGTQKFFLGFMGYGTTSLTPKNNAEKFHGRIYGLKVYNSSNVLTHDLEPYADNTVKDVVTGVYSSNQGTGNAVYR